MEMDIEHLRELINNASRAIPRDDDDWGSDGQIEAQDQFFILAEPYLPPAEFSDFETMKATADELVAECIKRLNRQLRAHGQKWLPIMASFDHTESFPAMQSEGDYWNGWASVEVSEETHQRLTHELYPESERHQICDEEIARWHELKDDEHAGMIPLHGYCVWNDFDGDDQ